MFTLLTSSSMNTVPFPAIIGTGVEHLPCEILGGIMLLAGEARAPVAGLRELRVSQGTIISCAQVSRRWRQVALRQSVLWARILDFERYTPRRLRELLNLSSPHPFNVGYHFAPVVFPNQYDPGNRVSKLFSLFYDHQDRIREWHAKWDIEGYCHAHPSVTSMLYTLKTPSLEAATWYNGGPCDTKDLIPAHRTIPSPHIPDLPLKRLDIRNINLLLTPSTTCLGTLTELSFCDMPMNLRPSLTEWIEILRATPNLQFLSIHSGINSRPHHNLPDIGPILLPHLSLISFQTRSTAAAQFLICLYGCIQGPLKYGVKLSLPLLDESFAGFVAPTLFYEGQIEAFNKPAAMELVVDSESRITLSNVRNPEYALNYTQLGAEQVLSTIESMNMPALCFQVDAPSATRHGIYVQTLQFLETLTARASSLLVNVDPHSDVAENPHLYPLFEGMGDLSHLELDQTAAEILLPRLVSGKSTAEYLLPSLATLTLDQCEVIPGLPLFKEVMETLLWRSKHGYPISKIFFTRSYVDAEALRIFKQLHGRTKCEVVVEPVNVDVLGYARFCRKTLF